MTDFVIEMSLHGQSFVRIQYTKYIKMVLLKSKKLPDHTSVMARYNQGLSSNEARRSEIVSAHLRPTKCGYSAVNNDIQI